MEIIGDRFRILERIGSGAFGVVYKAYDEQEKRECAVKMEDSESGCPQLLWENYIYKQLEDTPCAERLPEIYAYYSYYNMSYGHYNIMAMELVGENLESLFDKCKRRFSVKTVCQIAVQLIDCVKAMHDALYLHRDLKPENFMFKDGKIRIIDLGAAKRYRDRETNEHIPYKENKSLTGTPRYSSINSHLGIQMSRRDDMETIAYILIYFLRGSLPWMGIRATDKRRKYSKIMEKKMATPIDLLCKGYPEEFYKYLEYVRCLRFADKPDYDYLRSLFVKVGEKLDFVLDDKWDWDVCLEPVQEEDGDDHSSK